MRGSCTFVLSSLLSLLVALPASADTPPGTDYVSFWSGELRVFAQGSDTQVEVIDIDTGALLNLGTDGRVGTCAIFDSTGTTVTNANPFVLDEVGAMWACTGGIGNANQEIRVRILTSEAGGGTADKPVTVWTGFSPNANSNSWGSLMPSSFSGTGLTFGSEVGTSFVGFTHTDMVITAPTGTATTTVTIDRLGTGLIGLTFDGSIPSCGAFPPGAAATPCYMVDDVEVQAVYISGFGDERVVIDSNNPASVLTGNKLFAPVGNNTSVTDVNSDYLYSPPSFAAGDDGIELGTVFYTAVRQVLTIFPTQDATSVEITDLSDGDDTRSVFLADGDPANPNLTIFTPETRLTSRGFVTVEGTGGNYYDNDLVKITADKPILVLVGPARSDVREHADVAFSVPTGPESRVVYTFAQNFGSSNDFQMFAFQRDTQVTITSLTNTPGFSGAGGGGFHDFTVDFNVAPGTPPSSSPACGATLPCVANPTPGDIQHWGSGIWAAELLRVSSNRPITVISGDYDSANFGAYIPFVSTSPTLPPQAVVVADQTEICPNTEVCFDASGSFDQDDLGPEPQITRYDWAFSDGVVLLDAGPVVCHTFGPSASGSAGATVTVYDNEDPPSTDEGGATVTVLPPDDPVCDPCLTCTLTQGYWKTHNADRGPACLDPWPIDEDTLLCGERWIDILWTPVRGSAWRNLAHQWIAATLNVARGAATTPEVDDALAEGEALLNTCGALDADPVASARAIELSELLDDYNNGLIGPGHCDDFDCEFGCDVKPFRRPHIDRPRLNRDGERGEAAGAGCAAASGDVPAMPAALILLALAPLAATRRRR